MASTTAAERKARGTDLLGSTWTLDPAHTVVEFAVKHLMISTVKGRFGAVTGSLTIGPRDLYDAHLQVDIEAASIDTREEKRDAHLRSPDFLDVERFPRLTFVTRKVTGDLADEFAVAGDLTIRGVTKPVVLKARNEGRMTDPWGQEKLGFSATTKINRLDFGLQWNVALETGGVLVGDEVRISIESQFART